MFSEDSRRRILKIIAAVAVIAFVVSAAIFLINLWEKHNDPVWNESETMSETLKYGGKEYVLKDGVQTYLILGLDSEEQQSKETYTNDKKADFLLLLVVDNESETFRAIRINRDTIAKINVLGVAGDRINTVERPIAIAHTYGNGKEVSCRNTADAVSGLLLNAKVDHYLSIAMDAVPILNDLVGGVEVTIKDDFTGVDDTLIMGQTVTLMGEHVMSFIRARSSMPEPTNLNRMARQREYIDGLYAKTKVKVAEDEEFTVNAAKQILDYLVSDMTGERLYNTIRSISGYEMAELYDIDGTTSIGEDPSGNKMMEFHPDMDSLTQIVIDCFYREK